MSELSLDHVAFIPDGNRRWAASHRVGPEVAYREGAERAKEIISEADTYGIHTMTFWGLSTDNLSRRPPEEIELLSAFFVDLATEYSDLAMENDIRVYHLGNLAVLPPNLQEVIAEVQKNTANNYGHVLNLAVGYGGQDEIIRATLRVVNNATQTGASLEDLEADLRSKIGGTDKVPILGYNNYLDTAGQPYPYPDLAVRTSGELRSSGFMPFQTQPTEWSYPPELWPDFTVDRFARVLEEFNQRERRFGGDHHQEYA